MSPFAQPRLKRREQALGVPRPARVDALPLRQAARLEGDALEDALEHGVAERSGHASAGDVQRLSVLPGPGMGAS
jgi:hypothetical protein